MRLEKYTLSYYFHLIIGSNKIKHCVGHIPEKTEIDVPLTYADYYFVEAMERYKNYNKN